MFFVSKLKASLRFRLTLTYLGLAIVPLLLVAALAGHNSATELRGLSEALQRAIATRVAQEVTSFIDGRFEEIRMFALGSRLARLDAPTQQAILGKLLAHGGFYQEVKLIDASGRRRAHVSRTEVILTTHGTGRSHGEEFSVPLELGEAYFGQVRFDESLREPLATMSLPVFDLRSGETVFILVAVLRLARVWGLLGQMDLPREVDVFVLDAERRVVVHKNPATVLAGTRLPAPQPDGTIRVDGREFLTVSTALDWANQHLVVFAMRPMSIAYGAATRALTITAVVTTIAVIVAGFLVVLSVRQIVRPIEALARDARRVSTGDLDFEPDVNGRAEVGVLALAFGQMLGDLRQSMCDAREAHQRSIRQEKLAAIGQMSSELGHELRNPLATIANSVAVLDASSPGGDTAIRRSIERIRAQVQRISRLTNELLSFARTRAAQRTEVVIETLIEEALANRPPPANVVVNRDLPGERVTAFVDQEQIEQILENIASNAYEAMPDGGELTIRVRIEQGLVICALGDTGSGIEPEAIGQVFEPLFTTKREGVGLGLAICKNLTEANRGRLTVDSVVGEGTMFTLALPMVDEG